MGPSIDICTLLDRGLVVPLITTLDATQLQNDCRGSARRIHWIPLPSLQLLDSQSLFKDFKPNVLENASIKCAITACGGHPRTLEWLHDAVKDLIEESVPKTTEPLSPSHGLKSPAPKSTPEEELKPGVVFDTSVLDTIVFQCGVRFVTSVLSVAILRPVLLGEECSLTTDIGGTTVSKLIESGVYSHGLNSDGLDTGPVIPCVPPMHIYLWAKKQLNKKSELECILAKLILNDSITDFAWIPGSKAGTIFITHGKGVVFPGTNAEILSTELKYPEMMCKPIRALAHHFSYTEHGPLLNKSVLLPASGNPGFDVARGFKEKVPGSPPKIS
ncbi:hypothetical protein Pelo_19095 [Pelomyxa schiedti]|nr:hypothetical protein Pelo_19095 [Pelomyxa schiedti]